MCLAVPGQIVDFVDDAHELAKVEVSGVRRTIHVGLLQPEGVNIGDWVLIHVGFALSRIDEAEARRTLELLEQMGDPYRQELDQIQMSRIE
ncbi:MAG TPA: HypC/HybG/HupF family hydrogenase formation chaperone [Gemmatimonadales bacterium]|jgi:hydrogenase expression/formation protein HypC|nr:HypC/HybG/HupF family hydrogenase formation chaperone [Gemmatimonadales bacterium]